MTMIDTDVLLRGQMIVIVCQKGARVDDQIKYGAGRAIIELAQYLASIGRQVVLIGISEKKQGLINGIQFIGVPDELALFDTLQLISPIDTLIGDSRSDIFVGQNAKRSLIYQHGPYPPDGDFAIDFIRNQRIQLIVVSIASMESQQHYRIPKKQMHLVYNGYNSEAFILSDNKIRIQHRIVFAGSCVPYKGLDIAVQAFVLLKNDFPSAEFHIYGDTHEWSGKFKHFWPVDWLDEKGYPIWQKIERELPGLKYLGAMGHAELASAFQRASLLVMPSRINETFGIVSLEAQACGCIPVLPRQGGFPETMQEGITGFLYNNNTPQDLAEFISNLWTRNLPSEEQRLKAAEWVKQEFSWQKTGEQIAGILDKIPQERNFPLQVMRIFWKVVIHTKNDLEIVLDRIESPFWSRILKMPFQLLKRFYYRR